MAANEITRIIMIKLTIMLAMFPGLTSPAPFTMTTYHRKYHGMGQTKALEVERLVREYKMMYAHMVNPDLKVDPSSIEGILIGGDVVPTLEQIQQKIEYFKYLYNEDKRRVKRKVTDFSNFPQDKHTFPVYYQQDSQHTAAEQQSIRDAIAIWEDTTCVQMSDVAGTTQSPIVTFVKGSGCSSFIGKTGSIGAPQTITLSANCFNLIGIPVHEIGHMLGLHHEQSRPDRDTYVDILLQNVQATFEHNFDKEAPNRVITYNIPYEYGSVMHYAYRSFSTNKATLDTVPSKDARFKKSQGQRMELTFRDAKYINMAYCADSCAGAASLACFGEAYLDPKDCSRCRCPDGYGGTLCDQVATSDAVCGAGTTALTAGDTEQCIESPTFPDTVVTKCYWHLQAAAGREIQYRFDSISFPCSTYDGFPVSYCAVDWVEVRDTTEDNGQRFCCGEPLNTVYTSKSNKIMVMMRKNYQPSRNGVFKLCYKQAPDPCGNVCHQDATCTDESGSFACKCNAGYSGSGTTCTDINECTSNTDNCHTNAGCTNTAGSFTCACNTGYTGNGVICTDINECTANTDNCHTNAACTNTPGSFTCACNQGYNGDGVTCTEINECTANTDNCDANAACTNIDGSFLCQCNSGYEGNGVTCNDINECTSNTNNCHANAICTNTVGAFTCACRTGYSGNGFSCSDINECNLNTDNCHTNAACTNTVGSFTCACNTGYSGDGVTCTDINECTSNTDNCHTNAGCTNTQGSFTCACNTGYSGDGFSCSDINECTSNTDNCDQNAACMNNAGSFTCTCNLGYAGNGVTCTDINECTTNTDNCHTNAGCTNTAGSFTCACNTGYSGDGVSCADINECTLNTDNCHTNAACTNNQGSFTCSCNSGFSGNGVTCTDVNECDLNLDDCGVNAACTNTQGAFTCACNTGYNGDGKTCTDINECTTNTDNCHTNAACTNTAGSFTCACNTGYSGDGVTCTDINECTANTDNCHTNAACTNTPGSFTCACNSGYNGDGVTCTDNNECTTNADNCDSNAACTNTEGSFTCACNTGFNGNGISCVDINECTANTDNCHTNAACRNNEGSYTCSCNTGYVGNGITCTDTNECTLNTDNCNSNAACTNTEGSFTCACNTGFSGDGVTCNDINECTLNTDNCHTNAACTNTEGSFTCACNTGYSGDGVTCTDVNECISNTDNCDGNAGCTNNDGSFSCQCNTGYTGDGVNCIDINECDRNTDNCHTNAACTNNDGSFTCACNTGYSGDGVTCADVNECISNTDNCNANAACSNTEGSFTCQCNTGYSGDGVTCSDVNECTLNTDNCHTNAACTNTEGSFTCACNTGFSGDGLTCTDINECTLNTDNCHTNAGCTNTEGSFTCACNTGYSGNGVTCTDANECTANTDNCNTNAACTNTEGSFTCACNTGFSGDGVTCTDLDECTLQTYNCHANAACVNIPGSYRCRCNDGFFGDGVTCSESSCDYNYQRYANQKIPGGSQVSTANTELKCQDECDLDLACFAVDYNTVSQCYVIKTYNMIVPENGVDHFHLEPSCNTTKYTDCKFYAYGNTWPAVTTGRTTFSGTIEECFRTCIDTPGSACSGIGHLNGVCYIFTKDSSWGDTDLTLEGGALRAFKLNECSDADECSQGTDNCDVNAVCTNTEGSFTCACKPGYGGDGVTCSDVNECTLKSDNCDTNAICTNTVGLFTCACKTGYSGDGVTCSDIDECTTQTDNCHTNAACTNTEGSFTCACNTGYSGDGIASCTDINECTLNTDNCHVNAICTNAVGTFTCACKIGFSGDGVTCTDTNECTTNTDNCHTNAACTNTEGSFTCACNTGYSGDGLICSDINECATSVDNCDSLATCANSVGSFTCTCNTGYGVDGTTCTDINECITNTDNCHTNAGCTNTAGSFTCACNTGYSGDGVTCTDVNECADSTDNCHANATCANTPGSFKCTCINGFFGDGITCGVRMCDYDYQLYQDQKIPGGSWVPGVSTQEACTDRCDTDTEGCFAVDTNTNNQCYLIRSYNSLVAETGVSHYHLEPSCNTTQYEDCRFYTFGSKSPASIAGRPSTSATLEECLMTCIDATVNACSGVAYVSGKCYVYTAKEVWNDAGLVTEEKGLQGYRFDGCEDVDECSRGTDNCDANAQCTNTDGSFTCACDTGYSGDGLSCVDEDECALQTDSCDEHATCTNTVGSYDCRCDAGYSGDGISCQDIDECDKDVHNCYDVSGCTNTEGSFTCECDDGYTGDGVNCTDIDECVEKTADCDVSAECTNTNGSFTCLCNTGYSGNGTNCSDLDECELGAGMCADEATCANTDGSYMCECNYGYSGDGFICETAVCQFIYQLYTDTQLPGSALNIPTTKEDCLKACDADPQCMGADLTKTPECFLSRSYNTLVDATDVDHYHKQLACNSTKRTDCSFYAYGNSWPITRTDVTSQNLTLQECFEACLEQRDPWCSGVGYVDMNCYLFPNKTSWDDVEDGDQNLQAYKFTGCAPGDNECKLGTHNCSDNAECTNTAESYRCQCVEGYSGDGFTCTDLDECKLSADECSDVAVCTNTDGSYNCTCDSGYRGDGFACEDIDECAEDTASCHADATCANNNGSYTCTCKDGFSGDGKDCALSGSSCTFAYQPYANMKIPGGEWANPAVPTECTRRCDETPGCFAVDFNADNYCFLIKRYQAMVPEQGVYHYRSQPNCTSEKKTGCTFESFGTTSPADTSGQTLYSNSVTLTECLASCLDALTPLCNGVAYANRRCVHFSMTTSWKDNDLVQGPLAGYRVIDCLRSSTPPTTTSTTTPTTTTTTTTTTTPPTEPTTQEPEHTWSVMDGFHAPGGIKSAQVVGIEDCRNRCLVNPDCVAIDYDYSDPDNLACWLHVDPEVESRVRPLDSVSFQMLDREGNTKDECVPTYRLYPGQKVSGGARQSTLGTVSACQAGCDADSTCVSLDFNLGDNSCWFDRKVGNTVFEAGDNENVNHYGKAVTCGECSYELYPGRTPSASGQTKTLPTLDECLSACSLDGACRSATFDASTSVCVFYASSYTATLVTSAQTLTYYDSYDCQSQGTCTRTFRLYEGQKVSGGSFVPGRSTLADCQAACDAQQTCVSLDFNVQDKSCWIDITVANAIVSAGTEQVNHYSKGLQCAECSFELYPGRAPPSGGQTRSLPSLDECLEGCSLDGACRSATFDVSSNECRFYSSSGSSQLETAASTVTYYDSYGCPTRCTPDYTKSADSKIPGGENAPSATTQEACVAVCDTQRDTCVGADWNRQGRSCWLSRAKPRGTVVPDGGEGVDSYQRTGYTCDACSYTYEPGREASGIAGVEFTDVNDVISCLDACSALSACVAVNYYPNNSRCTYYTATTELADNSSADFLKKQNCVT